MKWGDHVGALTVDKEKRDASFDLETAVEMVRTNQLRVTGRRMGRACWRIDCGRWGKRKIRIGSNAVFLSLINWLDS